MPLLGADDRGRIKPPSGASAPADLMERLKAAAAGPAREGALKIRLREKTSRKLKYPDHEAGLRQTMVESGFTTFSTIEEAVNSFFLMDDKYREQVMGKMWFSGLIESPSNELEALGAWEKAVQLAWNHTSAGRPTDPTDMFGRMSNASAAGGVKRQTNRQVNFTDPAVARQWIRSAFQSSMGRDPHDAEIRQMLASIAEGNRNDPVVQESVDDGMGNVTQRVVDPGFDPQAFIAGEVEGDPEAGAHQAADVLYPALIRALGRTS
jgi:uncharacterized protein YneF (UPF0154 family)